MENLRNFPELNDDLQDHLAMNKTENGFEVVYFTVHVAMDDYEEDGYDANNSEYFDNEADALAAFNKRKDSSDGGFKPSKEPVWC